MKILHIVQSLDPAWGGIARVLPELATVLAQAGDECRIATLAGGKFGSPPSIDGVEVLCFGANQGSWFARSAEFDRRINELVSWADVVHLHGLWTGQNWSAGKAARRSGKPCIMTPHSMMMPWAWNRSWWKKRPTGWLFEHGNLRKAALLHALAPGEAEAMRALGFNSTIETIPNGIHVSAYETLPPAERLIARFPELKDRRWILFLGRIHPQKGIVQAMQAGFDVFSAAKQWHLIVAGPDEVGMRSVLEAAVRRKGAADRVTFTGMLDREDTLAALGGAEVLLQPSMSEGLSMSILEALASGVAVVISPACNMPMVQERGAGVIVEPQRRAIAGVLAKLVAQSTGELRAMGSRGRALAREQFDWSVLTPRYRAMYSRAVGR
ncbi:MAG: glycosyltransferase [Planctomycetes bacterium]|nr:glycosyltransferase [Planctomycetota bacterium]